MIFSVQGMDPTDFGDSMTHQEASVGNIRQVRAHLQLTALILTYTEFSLRVCERLMFCKIATHGVQGNQDSERLTTWSRS